MGCCPSNKGAPEYPQTIDLKKQFDEARPTTEPVPTRVPQPPVEKKPIEESKANIAKNEEESKKNEEPSFFKEILDLAKKIISTAPSTLGRSQITKILIGSLREIDPTFNALSNKKVISPEDVLKKLLDLLQELKTYCDDSKKNLKKSGSIKKGPKTSKIQQLRDGQGLLRKVGDYNEKICGLVWELKKPIEEEEEKKKQQKRAEEKSKQLAEELEGVIEVLEANNTEVVGLCQNDLTNEDAFSFWMEKFPNKYVVPLEEFERVFREA